MVETLSSSVGGAGSIPGRGVRELGSHMPCGQKKHKKTKKHTKAWNRSNVVAANSMKTLEMVHVQKKKLLKNK